MAMEHRIGRHMPKSKALAIRRALLMFVAFAYLFVGFAHTFAHSAEYLDAALASSKSSLSPAENGHDEDESKKSSLAGDHCLLCAPAMMPGLVADSASSLLPMQVAFSIPRSLLESRPRLDTPPPKHLT